MRQETTFKKTVNFRITSPNIDLFKQANKGNDHV